MSSVTCVKEIAGTDGGLLTARDAYQAVRAYGVRRLTADTLTRFRYGDGFSHARALGLQLCLTAIPLVIALVGLSSALRTESIGVVLRRTLLELTPGASQELLRTTLSPLMDPDGESNAAALVLGVAAALVALTTAMGQLERGANRVYGIQRDRPTLHKYGRALVMAVGAGLPAMAGFAVLVTAQAFADAVELVYRLDDDAVGVAVRPVGLALLLGAITVLLRFGPNRRQPGWSLLALGGIVALALWVVLTGLLAGFLRLASDFGTIYGPLTGIMALLIWAQLTAGSIFLGLATSAQLEAARGGSSAPLAPDQPPDRGTAGQPDTGMAG